LRRFVVPLLALCALAFPAAALADDPPDTTDTAPTPLAAPSLPSSVTDEAGASTFARAFLIAHAGDLVPGARAFDVTVQACDQVDAVQRFYCLAKARLATIQRIQIIRFFRGDRRHGDSRTKARAAGDVPGGDWTNTRDNRHNRPIRVTVFRLRLFACVAVVRIVGGPTVTPTATLPVRDCVRVNRAGQPLPTTTPTPTPY
jgi:hypothetical protein